MKEYQSIFKLSELEKWSLQNMESSVFQRGINNDLDSLDDKINYKTTDG